MRREEGDHNPDRTGGRAEARVEPLAKTRANVISLGGLCAPLLTSAISLLTSEQHPDQNKRPPSGTFLRSPLSGVTRTTWPSASGTPSVRTCDMNGPIWR